MAEWSEPRDPARHLVATERWDREPGRGTVRSPVTLSDAGASWRRVLDSGQATESAIDFAMDETVSASNATVTLSKERAHAIAALLHEFAVRVEPGSATGPIQADDSFSRVAADLADSLRSRV